MKAERDVGEHASHCLRPESCPELRPMCRHDPLPALDKGMCLAPCIMVPQVKVARSQNKTRRHGLGNHWVTGHQRLIRNYKVC